MLKSNSIKRNECFGNVLTSNANAEDQDDLNIHYSTVLSDWPLLSIVYDRNDFQSGVNGFPSLALRAVEVGSITTYQC